MRIHILANEDARLLPVGRHRRPYGWVTVHWGCRPIRRAAVRPSTGETYLVEACANGLEPFADWIVIDRDRVEHLAGRGMGCGVGCCDCGPRPEPWGMHGLGACPPRGSLPPGAKLEDQHCLPTALTITPTAASAPTFETVVGGGEGGLSGLAGKFTRWQTLTPSSSKLKSMLHMEGGGTLTPQQVELVRQLMHQGVPRHEIREILAKEELAPLATEQQELIPFQTEGVTYSPMGPSSFDGGVLSAMRRAPIDDTQHGADILRSAYAYNLSPRRRAAEEEIDVLERYIESGLGKRGGFGKKLKRLLGRKAKHKAKATVAAAVTTPPPEAVAVGQQAVTSAVTSAAADAATSAAASPAPSTAPQQIQIRVITEGREAAALQANAYDEAMADVLGRADAIIDEKLAAVESKETKEEAKAAPAGESNKGLPWYGWLALAAGGAYAASKVAGA